MGMRSGSDGSSDRFHAFNDTSANPTLDRRQMDVPSVIAVMTNSAVNEVSKARADCPQRMDLAKAISDPFQRRSEMLDAFAA